MSGQHSGLVSRGGGAVPLQGVRIEAKVTGACSEVTVTQRYRNTESVDVEAVYVFPLEEAAAVCGFGAQVGDRTIVGRVEEREKAFETYDDAMAEGHGAMLLDQERPNIFTASVGNIKPGQELEVWIRYVAQLQPEGRATRLMIPTTVSPRYTPASSRVEVGEPDHDRINPPRQDQVPYGLTLSVEIASDTRLVELESPSHTVRTRWTDAGAKVELSAAEAALDRDFVLRFEAEGSDKPRATVAREEDGTRVAMVTFIPNFEGMTRQRREVFFVLDCSGSMQGSSITEAKRALALCVRALDEGDRFNIVRFGSRFDTMWPDARAFSQQSLDDASRWIAGVDANMGGTEILSPLRSILERPRESGLARDVLLLTDGQVGNEADVIALCKQHVGKTRVFAFGIGAGVSEHLVRGVARASRGAAEFIHPGERIEPKVLRMFRRVASPSLQNIRIDWGGMEVEEAPVETPAVFEGEAVTIFGRIKHGEAREVVLSADEHRWSVPIDMERAQQDSPVPALWARARIRDIEDGRVPQRGSRQGRGRDRNRERLIELGTRYGLMTSVTSYVAVEQRSWDERSTGEAELRRVPVALTTGWGGRGAQAFGGAPVAASPPMAISASLARPAPSSVGGRSPKRARRAAAPPPPDFRSAGPPPGGRFDAPSAPPPPSAPRPMAPPSAAPMAPPAPAAAWSPPTGGYGGGGQGQGFDRMESEGFAEIADLDAEVGSISQASGGGDLFALLLTQRADGSFEPGRELRAFLGSRWGDLQALAQAHGAQLVATAVVLALLARRFGGRRDEWELAARKAERWLQAQGRSAPEVGHLL